MKFGLNMFPTQFAISPVELGREAEARGFESLFFPEHSHIPVNEARLPGDRDMPRHYYHSLEQFVALGAVATVTERLRLGTGITLVVERDPIWLAKEVATVDVLSNGRLLLGVGGGWNRTEMRHHGTDPSHRWKLMRERIEAMKRIWTEDEAEYHGEFVDFGPIWQWPKPVQRPHPPILVGGNGGHTLQRVVRYGDGWIPLGVTPDTLGPRMEELARLADEAGRGPIPVTVFGATAEPAAIERYAELGVERVIFGVPTEGGRDAALPVLERLTPLVERYAAPAR